MTPEQKDFAQSVGSRLRALRIEAGLERPELAERSGVKPSLIRDAEQGISRLTLDNAFKIARGLGVTVDTLLTGDKQEPMPGRGRPRKPADDTITDDGAGE